MRNLICKLFHRLSWPRQDEQGCYQVCLDDGRRLPWWDPMPLPSPFRKQHGTVGRLLKFKTQKEIGYEPVQAPHARRAIAITLERGSV